jgi:PAS domain S-box-containing protein
LTDRLGGRLKNDSEYLRTVLETVLDAIITIDERGIVQTANSATERLFGYREAELVGSNVSKLMPEPYCSAHDGYLANYLRTGEKKIIGIGRQVQGQRKDGSVFPMSLAVTEMLLSGGNRQFVGIVRDLSEQQRQLDHLTLLHAGLEAADEAIVLTDTQAVIVWFNSAFTRLTGYTEADAVGKGMNLLKSGVTPDALYRELWETVSSGREWRGELVNRRKDGSLYPEDQSITPVRNGGIITHYVAIKRNATARKQAEQDAASVAMAAYERLHGEILALLSRGRDRRAMLEDSLALLGQSGKYPTLALYLYDDWHGVLRCEATFCAPDSLVREVNPGDGLVGQAFTERRLLSIESADQMPLRIETGLLTITPVAVLASPIAYQERGLGVLILAATNTLSASDKEFVQRVSTELGAALQNLRQYEDLKAMAEQLKLRSQEITRKNVELEHTNQLKREFLANMSHELRTPLNAIIGFSEVLRDELVGPLNDKQSDYMVEIFDSANHLLSLINDILDLSKIEEGKMELSLEPVNVAEALRNSLSIVKEKAAAHAIRLSLEIGEEIGLFRADGRKLRQIVYNLLSNAVKFTPDGGQVRLAARLDRGDLCIEVSDTGIGIADADQARLFQPFEQLDGSLSRKQEGTGLGLAMVKRLVELHGGSVAVSSQLGMGSRFSVRLPAQPEEWPGYAAPPLPPPAIARPGGGRGATVLLVEDNEAAATLITDHLTAAGHTVIRAASGEQALRLAAQHRPALAVMDILLPDIDGWEVMRRMKQDPELQAIPVVIVSVMANLDKGLRLGALDVLEKPVQREWLLDAVARALAAHDDGQTPRILVVDDDPKVQEFICARLSQAGYRTVSALGGRQAIDLALESPPDLLIVDLMMPEVTGFDVIAALRAEERTARIPVIVLSAMQISAEERYRLAEDVALWVEKSAFDLSEFMRQVDKVAAPLPSRQDSGRSGKAAPLALVVEDSPQQAELLRIYLEDAGYEVRHAANGRLALDEMAVRIPDLIILDLLMPEMDGYAFLDVKAQRPEWQEIPVVVVSAVADRRVDAPPLAADSVLRKPIGRDELLRTLARYAPVDKRRGRRRILMVDDDPKAVKIIGSFLAGGDYELVTAFGGAEGLALARSEKPDLVLLDLMMPDMNGFEVLAALQDDGMTRDIPVIIVSAKLLSHQERDELHAKVAAIAEKSRISSDYLRVLIERALRGKGS